MEHSQENKCAQKEFQPNYPGIEQRRARHVYCIRYFRSYLFNSRDNSKNKYQNNTIVRRQSTALLSASHKREEHKAFEPPSSPTKLLNNTVRKKYSFKIEYILQKMSTHVYRNCTELPKHVTCSARNKNAAIKVYSERKCADTVGTVLVPWAGCFQCQNINIVFK